LIALRTVGKRSEGKVKIEVKKAEGGEGNRETKEKKK
jgi:hypothetical protein